MFKALNSRLRHFTSCTKGNVSIFMGLSAIPIMMGAGSAIDFGRYTNTHHDIAVALDAGLMAAAASVYNDTDVTAADEQAAKQAGLRFFKETLGAQSGANIIDPVFIYDRGEMTFSATVTGSVDMNFLVVAGFPALDLNVSAEAKSGYKELVGSDLEVSVMLDVTGSMCDAAAQPCTSGTSVDALKTAAKDLVEAVVWEDQSHFTSKVAIVPFSNRIRLQKDGQAGALYTAVTGLPATWNGYVGSESVQVTGTTVNTKKKCEGNSGHWWSSNKCYKNQGKSVTLKAEPCVTERYFKSTSTFGLNEEAPAVGRYNNGSDGTRLPASLDSSTTASALYDNSITNWLSAGPRNYSAEGTCDLASYYPAGNSKYGWAATDAIPNNNSVVPLTSDESTLNTAINNLGFQGGTGGMLGTTFAWNMISPSWASVWGEASAPQAYSKMTELNVDDKPKLYKIAVLMTDGVYNTAWSAPTQTGTPTLEENAKSICTAMKAKGIEIYTVGFNLAAGSTSRAMLENCATDATHFKDAASATDLKAAFKQIADRIRFQTAMEIRLIK
jgi:Flp pilus assembly protein TadG